MHICPRLDARTAQVAAAAIALGLGMWLAACDSGGTSGKTVASSGVGGAGGDVAGVGSTAGVGGVGGGQPPPQVCDPGDDEACYEGPDATQDVAACAAGVRSCASDGLTWGPCTGQQLPATEDCSSALDEDCDGIVCSAHQLSTLFSSGDQAHPVAVGVDSKGNMLVTGWFHGTLDFGGDKLTSSDTDMFVVKLDAGGNHVWSKRFGNDAAVPVDVLPRAVAVGPDDKVAVVGSFKGQLALCDDDTWCPLTTVLEERHGFVLQLDSDGEHIMSGMVGNFGDDDMRGIDFDSAGSMLVVGHRNDPGLMFCAKYPAWCVDPGDLGVTAGEDIILFKVGDDGVTQWRKIAGGYNDEQGMGVALDSDDNVLVTGHFADGLGVGVTVLESQGGSEVFVAKYQPNGDAIWGLSFGSVGDEKGLFVDVDAADNVYVAGSMTRAMLLGGTVEHIGADDIFVACFDGAGTLQWARSLGSSDNDVLLGFSADATGELALVGSYRKNMHLDGALLPGPGSGTAAFVIKLSPSGEHRWSKSFGAAGTTLGAGVGIGPDREVVIVGSSDVDVDFDGGVFTPTASVDGWLAKYYP